MIYAQNEVFEWRDELVALYDSMTPMERLAWDMYTAPLWSIQRSMPKFMPDLVLAPNGTPYLYRWYLFGNSHFHPEIKGQHNLCFHIQVASDPERPLHDHPWNNVSQIISGGYAEVMDPEPANQTTDGKKQWADKITDRTQSATQFVAVRKPGDIVVRAATTAHRLILPPGVPYTMTLFSFGPKVKDWGFWYPDGWHDSKEHIAMRDGMSVHVNRCDCDGGQGSVRHNFSCPSFKGL